MILKKLGLNILALTASIALVFTSCVPDSDEMGPQVTYQLSGSASGGQVRPNIVITNATGTISGNYNTNTNVLTYTINWTGLSGAPTAIELIDRNNTNQVFLSLPGSTSATGTVSGTTTLTEAREGVLLRGLVDYNIKTSANPNGEITGKIITQ